MQGVRVPYTHTAAFNEFNTGKQKWASMPFQMISKTAEAHAIRKGFSETSGLFIPEEIERKEDEIFDIEAIKKDILNCATVDNLRNVVATHSKAIARNADLGTLAENKETELIELDNQNL